MHRLAIIQRPNFRTQNPQTHLHEAVIQVREHDIVTTFGDVVVKRDRAAFVCVRMIQTGSRAMPRAGELRDFKNGIRGRVRPRNRFERRLLGQFHCDLDGAHDMVG